jgi:hypothetical protein
MTDDLDERLSQRFDGDDATEDSQSNQESHTETTASQAQGSNSAQQSQSAQNVKKEWNVRSFYLDDDLDSDLTTAFKRLDLELSEENAAVDLKKTRHFYPLVVRLGLEQLEEMDVTEVTEQLERTDSA